MAELLLLLLLLLSQADMHCASRCCYSTTRRCFKADELSSFALQQQ
jgi:hypothetical protein